MNKMKRKRIYVWKDIDKISFLDKYREKYKERQKDYYTLYIFDTYEGMYKYCKRKDGYEETDYGGRTMAYISISDDEKEEILSDCGRIYLCDENSIGDRTVAHEISHAVIGYFNRKIDNYNEIFIPRLDNKGRLDLDKANNELEELFAYMVGNMTDQIVTFYIDKYNKDKEESSNNINGTDICNQVLDITSSSVTKQDNHVKIKMDNIDNYDNTDYTYFYNKFKKEIKKNGKFKK